MKWDDIKLFLAVVEQGSLSAAARELKLGQPTLSRRIGELESLIGEALFIRQTQGVTLTSAGEKLLPAAQRMAEWANEATQSLSKQKQQLSGKIKIAAPPGVALDFVVPLAQTLQQHHPQLRIEVLAGIETLNLSRGEADISLRTRAPTDDDLICLDQIKAPMRILASSAYIKQLPDSYTLDDLDWICWSDSHQELQMVQELKKQVKQFNPVFTSNDFNIQMAACRAGLGVMLLAKVPPIFPHLNQLHELNIAHGFSSEAELFVVCHKRHRHLPKVAIVLEAISAQFALARRQMA
ncbi:LysR family transcriptional regulator [Solimicrobium silvestre]|uniref:LysR substrate binding domain n=1 Tax=Solimicrobium silvestre TaxID=2099400 RepID=A0A2S9GZ90_9BURK|nr:LysR family transcriptional regulator [Solimicrobium silvestre]PRC92946.1 LysR substrate binding domain [Solimicrobium silvestre]